MVQLMTAPPDGVWVVNGGWSWDYQCVGSDQRGDAGIE
jgi:hypothetical protein